MSLDKSIKHGKEHRRPYYGAKAADKSCRNHGSDPWAEENRRYCADKRQSSADEQIRKYNEGEEI